MARWTDLATWRGPTPNQTRGHVECRGLVVHISQGSFESAINWCKTSSGAQAVSTHFVAAKDGRIAQLVDTDDTAWTQAAGNGHWLSVECEGFTPGALTSQQVESVAKLLARGHAQYGYPLQVATSPTGKGLGHHSMGTNGHDNPTDTWTGPSWGHTLCPGPNIVAQKPAIVARAQEIVGGDDMTPAQAQQLTDVVAVVDAMVNMRSNFAPAVFGGQPVILSNFLTDLRAEVDAIKAAVDALTVVGADHQHPGGVTGPAQPLDPNP